ncbi:MAG: hypothetical protein ABJC36_10585 [Gemmatimonadales bacterium]
MKTSIVAGSLLTALTLTVPLQAQQVAAHVIVRSGPVAGHVVIGNGYSTYRRPVAYRAPERVIVVERVAPRVLVVERVRHGKHGRNWRAQGYRPVVVYYRDGRYYDRYVRGWPEMHQVVVYQRNGRLYRECDDDRDRHDNRHWDD